MSHSHGSKPGWQELYEAALLETDREKLTDLLNRLEEALPQREQQRGDGSDNSDERNAMAHVSKNVLAIKTEKLGWPSTKTKQLKREVSRGHESLVSWHRSWTQRGQRERNEDRSVRRKP
jgi:hypothetical protein